MLHQMPSKLRQALRFFEALEADTQREADAEAKRYDDELSGLHGRLEERGNTLVIIIGGIEELMNEWGEWYGEEEGK